MGYDRYITLNLQPEDLKDLESTRWTQEELKMLYEYLYEEVCKNPDFLEPFGLIFSEPEESLISFVTSIGGYEDGEFLMSFDTGGSTRTSLDVFDTMFFDFSKKIPHRMISLDVQQDNTEFFRLHYMNGLYDEAPGKIVYSKPKFLKE